RPLPLLLLQFPKEYLSIQQPLKTPAATADRRFFSVGVASRNHCLFDNGCGIIILSDKYSIPASAGEREALLWKLTT
ncbi:MAG: hypothetical protein LUF68_03340, partial [Clostridiales bacterium]|nr:hypothetical protein [Clostridiales bacterium]